MEERTEMTEMKQDRGISYNNYLFGKDFPIDGETDLGPDGQRRILGEIDKICEDHGGVFLGYTIDEVLNSESMGGIKCRYESAHLVGTHYVESRIILDGSGNSPKRHSMNTSVKCVSGTDNNALLKRLTELYKLDEMPSAWTEQKSITT